MLASPAPSSLTASRSGPHLAWVFTLRGVANVWAADGPDFEGRQLTSFESDDGRPLSVLGFSPDNGWVFFAKSSRFNPDSRPLGSGESKLYRVARPGGEPEELAEAGSAAVSPVEPKLAFVKKGELWLVEPGKEAVQVVDARGTLTDPEWLPDGKRVAFLRRLTGGHYSGLNAKSVPTPDPWEVRVAEVTTGRTVRAWRSGDSDSFTFAEVNWLDDKRLVSPTTCTAFCYTEAGSGPTRRWSTSRIASSPRSR